MSVHVERMKAGEPRQFVPDFRPEPLLPTPAEVVVGLANLAAIRARYFA